MLKDAPDNIRQLFDVSARADRRAADRGQRLVVLEGGDAAYPADAGRHRSRQALRRAGLFHFPRRCGGTEFFRGADCREGRAESRCGCCWTASARAISILPPIIACGRAASRRPASCTPGCPGACRSSTCATTASCWWWTAQLAFMGGMNIGAENSPDPASEGFHHRYPFPRPGAGGAADHGCLSPATGAFTTNEVLDEDFWWPDLAPQGRSMPAACAPAPMRTSTSWKCCWARRCRWRKSASAS